MNILHFSTILDWQTDIMPCLRDVKVFTGIIPNLQEVWLASGYLE